MSYKYIYLYNPHDEEYKIFKRVEGRELYAPNYRTPITSGKSVKGALRQAAKWGISIDEVEVC